MLPMNSLLQVSNLVNIERQVRTIQYAIGKYSMAVVSRKPDYSAGLYGSYFVGLYLQLDLLWWSL